MIPSAAKHCGGRASQFIKYVNSLFRDNRLKKVFKNDAHKYLLLLVSFSHICWNQPVHSHHYMSTGIL